MEVNSAIVVVAKNQFFTNFKREILDSPKNSTIFFLLTSVLLSIVVFGGFQIEQNITVVNQLKQNQTNAINQAQMAQKQKQQEITNNLNALDQTRKRDLINIQSRLKTFYQAKGYYPSSLFNLVPDYLGNVPQDPETGQEYYYLCGLNQKSFTLKATLSNGQDFELTN